MRRPNRRGGRRSWSGGLRWNAGPPRRGRERRGLVLRVVGSGYQLAELLGQCVSRSDGLRG